MMWQQGKPCLGTHWFWGDRHQDSFAPGGQISYGLRKGMCLPWRQMRWYCRERALPVLVCKAGGGRRALLGGAGWDQTPRDGPVSPAVPDSCTASGQGPCWDPGQWAVGNSL